MDVIDKEDIIKLFNVHKIEYIIQYDEHNFWRSFCFKAREKDCKIIWYRNLITLIIDYTVEVKFHNLTINGNFPNRFKNNINFLFNEENICILPLERYKK